MTATFLSLLPVFIVIMVGLALRKSGLIGGAQWVAVDQVCYFALFPAIIFKEIAGADFTGVPVAGMAAAMMLALATMFVLLLGVRARLCAALAMDGPQFSSLFQGATRWHTFIGLAIIPVLYGERAMALGAVAAAAMIPLLNIVNVAVLSIHASGTRPDIGRIVLSVARNPFVLSSLGGIAVQALGIALPAMTFQVLDMIGKGALGLALLTVGAGLRLDEAMSSWAPVALGTALKLLVMPLLMLIWLRLLDVSGEPAAVALLCGAVPTGSGAYVLARQMGGDAPMVANILTAQVICAALTIPLVLAWLTW